MYVPPCLQNRLYDADFISQIVFSDDEEDSENSDESGLTELSTDEEDNTNGRGAAEGQGAGRHVSGTEV